MTEKEKNKLQDEKILEGVTGGIGGTSRVYSNQKVAEGYGQDEDPNNGQYFPDEPPKPPKPINYP